MKKHWKNVCVNYLQNVKFRVKKKVSAFGSRPCFATTSMKMMMKIASTSLFSCFDKKEEDLISLRYMNQGLQNCMTNFFCANLVTLVAFLRRTMQNYSSFTILLSSKKEKIIWIWWLFSDLHWIFKKERKIVCVFFWWNMYDNFCFVPEHFSEFLFYYQQFAVWK